MWFYRIFATIYVHKTNKRRLDSINHLPLPSDKAGTWKV